jgi:hypothetical protein
MCRTHCILRLHCCCHLTIELSEPDTDEDSRITRDIDGVTFKLMLTACWFVLRSVYVATRLYMALNAVISVSALFL